MSCSVLNMLLQGRFWTDLSRLTCKPASRLSDFRLKLVHGGWIKLAHMACTQQIRKRVLSDELPMSVRLRQQQLLLIL